MVIEVDALDVRARRHAALGDPVRLRIVDALHLTDLTPGQLRDLPGLGDVASNLLAHHLGVLEEAGLVVRRRSDGDGRRRYVALADGVELATGHGATADEATGPVLFVCSRNAARSQLAAALWTRRTGAPAASAGATPAAAPDPQAVDVARAHGLDTAGWRSVGYGEVGIDPAVVVSVCDRAREGTLPWPVRHLHWSVPDPAGGPRAGYELAHEMLSRRVDRLAAAWGEVAA